MTEPATARLSHARTAHRLQSSPHAALERDGFSLKRRGFPNQEVSLIQPAGWGGGQHEWDDHIREILLPVDGSLPYQYAHQWIETFERLAGSSGRVQPLHVGPSLPRMPTGSKARLKCGRGPSSKQLFRSPRKSTQISSLCPLLVTMASSTPCGAAPQSACCAMRLVQCWRFQSCKGAKFGRKLDSFRELQTPRGWRDTSTSRFEKRNPPGAAGGPITRRPPELGNRPPGSPVANL